MPMRTKKPESTMHADMEQSRRGEPRVQGRVSAREVRRTAHGETFDVGDDRPRRSPPMGSPARTTSHKRSARAVR